MILDEEGDGDWVCIEPVVRVAGVELQFTFVIELALSKEVVFYFYMSQEEEGPPGALWPIWYCASFRDKEIPKSSI